MNTPQPARFEATELLIETVGAQGDGIAAGPIYVPLTLPDERILAAGHHGERARLHQVLTASRDRVAPPCPHFGACGGCALQHWAHAPYLRWKVEQIRAALARERMDAPMRTPFAAPPGSRRRLALHARRSGQGAAIGYKARRTWSLVEIAVCPIADARLVAALPALRTFAAAFLQHPRSAPVLHATWTDSGLDVDVTGVEAKSGGLSGDARVAAAQAAEAGGFARATLGGEILYQARRPLVRFGRAEVVLPSGGFLQAVAAAEEAMVAFTIEAVAGATRVADLFCGSGAFTLRLAERAQVLAIDGAEAAVSALKVAAGSTAGLRAIRTEVRDLVRRPLLGPEMKPIDAAVFDPPRAGAIDQARELARSKVERVVGVSCNPSTFARDARILVDGGFRLTAVLPVDQFLWSPHIELVGAFER